MNVVHQIVLRVWYKQKLHRSKCFLFLFSRKQSNQFKWFVMVRLGSGSSFPADGRWTWRGWFLGTNVISLSNSIFPYFKLFVFVFDSLSSITSVCLRQSGMIEKDNFSSLTWNNRILSTPPASIAPSQKIFNIFILYYSRLNKLEVDFPPFILVAKNDLPFALKLSDFQS